MTKCAVTQQWVTWPWIESARIPSESDPEATSSVTTDVAEVQVVGAGQVTGVGAEMNGTAC
jgi:hypothetical protein